MTTATNPYKSPYKDFHETNIFQDAVERKRAAEAMGPSDSDPPIEHYLWRVLAGALLKRRLLAERCELVQ